MNNPLARRLIQINQETLAIKTAHQHGAGAIKMYQYELNITGYDEETTEFYRVIATVKDGSSPFPVLEISTNDWANSVRREGSFSNDGMTFTCRFNILKDGIKVIATSTSPLESLEGSWL